MPLPPPATPFTNPQKQRKGLGRMLHATGYSIQGLRAGWNETAFRQESIAAMVLIPSAFWVGETWVETSVLVGCVVLLLITELLNTGIEAAIDRISEEWHPLAKKAKDTGSAAVFLALLLCSGVWCAALWHRLM